MWIFFIFFFFQAEDGIRDVAVTGVQTCALPISPDGSKILFETNRDGNWEVYVMNADGSGPLNLSNNPASEDPDWTAPAWSPDGSKIAFRSDRDGNLEIYVMNADGSGVTRLTSAPGADWNPAWSPEPSAFIT